MEISCEFSPRKQGVSDTRPYCFTTVVAFCYHCCELQWSKYFQNGRVLNWGRRNLSVLKRRFLKRLRLRSVRVCVLERSVLKCCVSVSRLPNGKPQERLWFRDLRGKTLAFKNRIAIISCVLEASLMARACVRARCVEKTRRFVFAFLSPLRKGLSIIPFAKGTFAKGILEGTWFSLFRRESVPELPSHTGQCKSASWWPLLSRRALTCERGIPGRFPTGKGKTPVTSKIPLAKIPLAQRTSGDRCQEWPDRGASTVNYQGALKGTNLRGQTEQKRRFSQIFADFCRFSPSPRKQSIWETQIFAENRRCLAGNRRKPQEPAENRRLAFVPLGSSP